MIQRHITAPALALLAAAVLSGCASKNPIDLSATSAGTAHSPVTIKTDKHSIRTLQPNGEVGEVLRVYIEGDGRAWITSRSISDDPTPITSFMPALAVSDEVPAVYMARPCQFIQGPGCTKSLWTDRRFSQEAVDALSQALDSLKTEYRNQQFELVGYSGGGAMALLLAAERDDIAQVQTIGGNIDTSAWVAMKKLSPLSGSLNPTDFAEKLAGLTQRHIVGTRDKTVPSEVAESYLLKVQPECGEVVYVNSDHWDGYEASWKLFSAKPIKCD